LGFHENTHLKNVWEAALGGWVENCVDSFSSAGSLLKASLLTRAVGFSWGIGVATHLPFGSHNGVFLA